MRFQVPLLAAALGAATAHASPLDATSLRLSTLFARQNASANAVTPRANVSSCATSNGTSASSFSPSLYTEPQRPQVHFSPTSSFMNDPNGLVYRAESSPGAGDDLWFMSYQYSYNISVAGNQHWGLASSKNLWEWTHHDPIISPEQPGEGIFSGSSVVDYNNTSGFFNDSVPASHRIVAIYTLNTPEKQTQNIAYTTDGGFTYVKYEGNPVIDRNELQFRDPKVLWHAPTQKWVMATSLSQQYSVVFYTSSDLKSWEEAGAFSNAGLLGYQYECANLFEVPVQGGEKDGQTAWVLLLSINPGASSQGGSFMQYFLGDFDGGNFTSYDAAARLLEFGPDSYAAQAFSDSPGYPNKSYLISWASNWLYTQQAPISPWRGAMTVARELSLRWYSLNPEKNEYVLSQTPIDTTPVKGASIRDGQQEQQQNGTLGNTTVALTGSGAFDMNVTFSVPANSSLTPNSIGSLIIKSTSGTQSLRVGVQMNIPAQVFLDRRHSTANFADRNPFFVDRFSTIVMPNLSNPGNSTSAAASAMNITLRAIVDKSIVEVYAQDGIASATANFWFDNDEVPASVDLELGDDIVQASDFSIAALNSTWTCFVES